MVALTAGLEIKSAPTGHQIRAAQNAAKRPHALVNLVRMVKLLEASVNDISIDEEDEESNRKVQLQLLQRHLDGANHARIVLDILRNGNEQSSNTVTTLNDLEKTLVTVEEQMQAAFATSVPASLPLSRIGSRQSAASTPRNAPSRPPTAPPHPEARRSPSPPPASTPATTLRKRNTPALATYLSTRSAEDQKGDEIGLLPIRQAPVVPAEKSGRDQLLSAPGMGMGAAQLHEELGGQLADMSHQLKLNAVHFSNSLEAEKALLESSQSTLENNLTATKSSKKDLSAVSRKSKGTTCMTLGIVILVLIIFVWTYMLIKFT